MKRFLSLSVLAAVAATVLFLACPPKGNIKIGAVLPMTGAAAGYGKWMQRGIDLAVEDINKAGGINGRKLAVLTEDSKSDNTAGVNAATKLVDVDKVPAIVTVQTGVTQAIIPVTEKSKVILFTAATAPGLTEQGKYVFRNATNMQNEVDRMIEACTGILNLRKVAIMYVNNPVGVWFGGYFGKAFAQAGGKVVASESFQPDAADFRTQLQKVKTANPEALYIQGYKQNGLVMKQARQLGLNCKFLGATDMELPDVLTTAGSSAEGVVYTKAAFDPNAAAGDIATYTAKYKERYGEEPEVYGATAYDAVKIIAGALATGGSDAEKMKAHILAIKGYPGVSGVTTFMSNGDVQKPVDLKQIKDGTYVSYMQ
jgi:branched-chain amino acid transport system substrate-binding protein